MHNTSAFIIDRGGKFIREKFQNLSEKEEFADRFL